MKKVKNGVMGYCIAAMVLFPCTVVSGCGIGSGKETQVLKPVDIEKHTVDADQHTVDIDQHTADINQHTVDADQHTVDIDKHTRDIDAYTPKVDWDALDTDE